MELENTLKFALHDISNSLMILNKTISSIEDPIKHEQAVRNIGRIRKSITTAKMALENDNLSLYTRNVDISFFSNQITKLTNRNPYIKVYSSITPTPKEINNTQIRYNPFLLEQLIFKIFASFAKAEISELNLSLTFSEKFDRIIIITKSNTKNDSSEENLIFSELSKQIIEDYATALDARALQSQFEDGYEVRISFNILN